MKPLYKWSGGKYDEIKMFKKYYPEFFDTYIEPFFGAGAAFFDLNFDGKNVVNDVHPESIQFLNSMKSGHGKDIHELMSKCNFTEDEYYYFRDRFVPKDDVEKSFLFYYLRKTCYRGMLRYNSKGKFNIPFGRYKKISYDNLLIDDYEKLLKKTEIYMEDFSIIMEKYDSKDKFIFLDPPYDSVFTDYGYCVFDKKKHLELADQFKRSKSKCLLVIGETEFIKDLYGEYIAEAYEKEYRFKIHSGRVGKEINNNHLVIKNY